MPVLYLNQPPQRLTLEILLRFLEDEIRARHRPAFCDARERHGAGGGEVQEVGCAQGEVGEDFEVADAVGAELEVAGWDAVGCGSF